MVSRLSCAVSALVVGLVLGALPVTAAAAQQEKPAQPTRAAPAREQPKRDQSAPPKTSGATQRDKAKPAAEPQKRAEPKPPPKSTGEPALRRRKP